MSVSPLDLPYHISDEATFISKELASLKVATHHRLDNPRKTAPGEYFDWQEILPCLPTDGKLVGTEATGGGMFAV